jgi:non-canonical purine NTP pyrophosphatase (RdgB/HAM1 family)
MVVKIVTTNADKAAMLRACLDELGLIGELVTTALVEPQAGSLREVAEAKAREAHTRYGGPLLVEDSGLAIESLGGFPGPYTKYVLATIGGAGLALLAGGRACRFASAIVAVRRDGTSVTGEHGIDGHIANIPSGPSHDLGSVFVAAGTIAPFATLGAGAAHLLADWRVAITAWLREAALECTRPSA